MNRPCFPLFLLLCAVPRVWSAAVTPPEVVDFNGPSIEYVVTATREARLLEHVPLPVDVFGAEQLQHAPGLTLDSALRTSPAFNLFRRTDSLSAHPTTQGVSLRGLGPSGASRSLILLDGVPLNDPFGGWVTWQKVPRNHLRGVEIVHGGGSSTWGNGALGGAVQVLTARPGTGENSARAIFGDRRSRGAEFTQNFGAGPPATSALRVSGRWFATDGDYQFASAQRGPIDQAFDSRHLLANVDYAHTLASGAEIRAGLRGFDEERGNGTPYQRNRAREFAAHFGLSLRPGFADHLDVTAYAQRQRFASGFSAVNDARTAETPALDQFRVPATAWGVAAISSWGTAEGTRTVVGVDTRGVTGETREDFFFSGGALQRRRFAGGEQLFAGVFGERVQAFTLGGGVRALATASARVDTWRNADGHRLELVKATGATVRNDRFPNRDGVQFNPSLGVVLHPVAGFRIRASAYRAFRTPTLNELHRPFRVGNVATEANPALALETLAGWDVSAETQHDAWKFSAGLFESHVEDAVANVTLSSTPALTQRQRLNLDEVRVNGIESMLAWEHSDALTLTARYLFSNARVKAATVAPALVGRRLAQVPRHILTIQGDWRPAPDWTVSGLARMLTEQFEDDENALELKGATTVDLALRWRASPRWEAGVAMENVFDARVETARTAAGLISLGTARRARVEGTVRW